MQDAAGATLVQDTVVHSADVAIHVLLGTAALGLGVRQLAAKKGDALHRRVGRWFLACVWGAVGAAAIGILIFEFRAFLGVTPVDDSRIELTASSPAPESGGPDF